MKTIKVWTAAVLCALLSAGLQAQKVGTSSLQFLKVISDARGTAMGDAYGTLASGANALFWNPAGIAQTDVPEISGAITMWLFDTQQDAVAVTLPLQEWGTVGLQFQYIDYGSIQVTRRDNLEIIGTGSDTRYNPGLTGESYSPSTMMVGLSFARKLTDKFCTGVSVKLVQESLWGSSKVTIVGENGVTEDVNTYARLLLFDFGLQYNTGYRTIRINAVVQNFGPQVKFAKEGFPAPMAFRIGAASDIIGSNALLTESEDNRLTIAYDLFQPNDYFQQMHAGVEYSFGETVFLRAGYKFYYDNDNVTAGFGVRQALAGFPVSVDYSYGNMGEYLPSVHRIGVGVQMP